MLSIMYYVPKVKNEGWTRGIHVEVWIHYTAIPAVWSWILLGLLSVEGWLVQVWCCVFLQCLWTSRIFSWGGKSTGEPCAVTQSIFSDLCMLHGHIFILSYKDTRNLLTVRDLIRRALSLLSGPLCVGHDRLYIQQQPNMYSRGHLGHLLCWVVLFCLLKRLCDLICGY